MIFALLAKDKYREDTHITSNISALLARDKWDVFMVQLVACRLRVVPGRFVEFLKSHRVGKVF